MLLPRVSLDTEAPEHSFGEFTDTIQLTLKWAYILLTLSVYR